MKIKLVYVIAIVLLASLSIAYAALKYVETIPTEGKIIYPSPGTWEIEGTQLNFWAVDVVQGGTTVVAGMPNSGQIYRSDNEGQTWESVFTIPGAQRVRGVFIDSRGYFFVSGQYGDGIYRSIDGGNSWARCLTHPGSSEVEFSENSIVEVTGVLYLGTYTMGYVNPTIYRSTDGGASWTPIASFGSGHIHAIRYAAATGKLWVWVGDPGYSGYGFYWSDDLGVTWNRTSITEGSINGYNIMGFETFGNYIFFSRHWSNAELYRADFSETDGIPPNNPSVVEVWRGRYTLLNWVRQYKNSLLASGEAGSGEVMRIGGSSTPPFESGTWKDIYVDGTSGGSYYGCAAASHHWSLNGWFFVSNTITGQGLRIRYT